jgi:hypothetical protein
MGASAGTDVELRLSAVTENFKTEMKESARELRTWGKGINEVSGSMVDFTRISGSIGEVFEGVQNGNYGEMFKGIGGSVKELALGVPAMAAGFRTAIGMMQGIAPLAIQIAGAALPIAAVAAAVYMGVAAWNSYKESEQAVTNMGKELHAMLEPVAAELEATRKRVQNLTGELAVLGESPASQKLIKANAEYARASQAYFGNMNLYDEQIGRVAGAEGELLLSEIESLKFLKDKINLKREQMGASRAEIDLLEKMASAQKRLEAAQKWQERKKEFSDWGVGGQTPMTVMTSQGVDAEVHEEAQRALAEINVGALASTREALKRIDNVARAAGEEYVASLSKASSSFDDAIAGAYDLAANTFGAKLVSDVVDFANKLSNALSEAINAAKAAGSSFLSNLNLSYSPPESTAGLTAAEKARAKKEERINNGLDVMRAGIQGAQQGGIWGAFGAALAALLSKTKGFMGMLSILGEGFGKLSESTEPLMDAIGPLIIMLGKFGEIITKALMPIIKIGIIPAIMSLFYLFKYLGLAIMYIIKGLGTAWNWIVDAVDEVIGWFGGSLDKIKFNMDGLNRSIDEINDMTISSLDDQMAASEDASSSLSNLGDVADSVAESLTNIPSGYKVALAHYNAISTEGGSGSATGPYHNYNSITIQNLSVSSDDPKEMFNKIQNEAARRNLVRVGTRLAYVGSPYLGR